MARNQLKLLAGDTEDNSAGQVFIINFFDGTEHFTFETQEKAIQWLLNYRTNLEVWFTNLQYDLINIFGNDLSMLEINYAGSRIISARLPNTKVFFRDTLNHWKIGVFDMGKLVGLPKLDLIEVKDEKTGEMVRRRRQGSEFNDVDYCQRDTEIVYRFVSTRKANYERIGAKLKSTIGATALDFFNKKYFKYPKARRIDTADLVFMGKGYYGGREEIFFNKPIEGVIHNVDINGMYPDEMAKNPYPIIGKGCYKKTRTPNLQNMGVAHARVTAPGDLYLPYLPFRCDRRGLIFPLGTFDGHWTFFELREAVKLGYRIEKIYQAIEFTRGHFFPFKRFVQDMYAQRLEAADSGDQLLADDYKNIMNNIIGKFGQGRDYTRLVPYESSKQLHKDDAVLGDMVLKSQKMNKFPVHTNVIWSAMTNAYGRHRIYQGLQDVIRAGGLPLYCATDSIIYEGRKVFKYSKNLGDYKLVGRHQYAWFKLPKLYKLIDFDDTETYKTAGIPKDKDGGNKHAKQYFNKGKTKYERPYKLKETLRRNLSPNRKIKLIPNFWDETTKTSNKKYDKRVVLRDGNTKPIILGAEDERTGIKNVG